MVAKRNRGSEMNETLLTAFGGLQRAAAGLQLCLRYSVIPTKKVQKYEYDTTIIEYLKIWRNMMADRRLRPPHNCNGYSIVLTFGL